MLSIMAEAQYPKNTEFHKHEDPNGIKERKGESQKVAIIPYSFLVSWLTVSLSAPPHPPFRDRLHL